jgi:hypothetical protein
MTDKKMQSVSEGMLKLCEESGLTPHEAMVTLAMTLASGFYIDKLTKHQAISRFTTIVNLVYSNMEGGVRDETSIR